jgi:beta-glucosidase/6-phospho-beta-glucosidase/beta-galactosidase
MASRVFKSFFLGGFECSTHRLRSGRRLDLIRSTAHDTWAARDYAALQRHGIEACRDGLRWHLIEAVPGRYDFASLRPMLQAARATGMQVVWDLWHYGWPDHYDLFSPAFVDGFAAFAAAAIRQIAEFGNPWISPVNEISFFSWAAGDGGIFNPFATGRGDDVKRQLVRASVAAIRAMRAEVPATRVFQVDPMINVLPVSAQPADRRAAEAYRQSQFHAWDMLLGRAEPALGGAEDLVDVIGVNYYIHNQFVWHGSMIVPSDPRYRHVSVMLREVYERYRRPLFVAETGIEDESRPAWLRYMCREVFAAMADGVPVEGLCLYPVVNHPGWDDDRHCHNGLLDYADADGDREVYAPLADELARQRENVAALVDGRITLADMPGLDVSALDWAAHTMQERTDAGRTADA